jgi:hypothetical protein
MGRLGRKLIVALVAAGAGAASGLSSGAVEGKRPIVQAIAASQPTRVKRVVFHPSAIPKPERPATPAASLVQARSEITLSGESASRVRTAPVARGALAVGSGLTLGLTDPWRRTDQVAASKKPGERPRRGPSARFGQSEIVDPWSTKR